MGDRSLLPLIIDGLYLSFVKYLSPEEKKYLDQFCKENKDTMISLLYKNYTRKVKLPRNICGPTVIYKVDHEEKDIHSYLFGELHKPLTCREDIRASTVILDMCRYSKVPITLLIEDTAPYDNSYFRKEMARLRKRYNISDSFVDRVERDMDIVRIREHEYPPYVTKVAVDIRDLHTYPGLAADAYFRYKFPPSAIPDFLHLCCDKNFHIDNYISNLESRVSAIDEMSEYRKKLVSCKLSDFKEPKCRTGHTRSLLDKVASFLEVDVQDDSYRSMCKITRKYLELSPDDLEEDSWKRLGEDILRLFSESTISLPLVTQSVDYYTVAQIKKANYSIFYGGEYHTDNIAKLLEEDGFLIEKIDTIPDDYFPI